jgi:RNA polymerase I-specific transcription initiation factor RRN3
LQNDFAVHCFRFKKSNLGQQKYPSIPDSVLFQQIHVALGKILLLIPAGPSAILPILTQIRPHKSDPVELILFYVRSLLHISTYASVLSSDLLCLAVDLIVQMDVCLI